MVFLEFGIGVFVKYYYCYVGFYCIVFVDGKYGFIIGCFGLVCDVFVDCVCIGEVFVGGVGVLLVECLVVGLFVDIVGFVVGYEDLLFW